jgi:hypothetical protein
MTTSSKAAMPRRLDKNESGKLKRIVTSVTNQHEHFDRRSTPRVALLDFGRHISLSQQVSRSAGQQVSRSAGQQVRRQQGSRAAGQQGSRAAGRDQRLLAHLSSRASHLVYWPPAGLYR